MNVKNLSLKLCGDFEDISPSFFLTPIQNKKDAIPRGGNVAGYF